MTLFDQPKARNTDPLTSHEAAAGVSDANAADWVLRVMRAGALNHLPRMIDEQIAQCAEVAGCPLSPDRLRHGRKALVTAGTLRASGTAKTSRNKRSIAWEIA